MNNFLKGIILLAPSVLCLILIGYVASIDALLRNILTKMFYGFSVIVIAAIAVLLLMILWQWTRAGLLILIKMDLHIKK